MERPGPSARRGLSSSVARAAGLGGLALLLLLSAGARAESESSVKDLRALSLEELLAVRVRVATKSELAAAQTPAVVTVISGEEIEARGYTSLAEVLRAVPGFYDVYDGVTHNIGVRGINGGQNAAGSVIKLMIDGHPIDYRPTTGNFFGEELIPLQAIERVEIIRGPASALYGANAFLGVVNVVTRSGGGIGGARLVGRGGLERTHPGGGGGLVMGGASGPVDVLLGASYLYLDRSGLGLPASSPLLTMDTHGVAGRAPSQNDIAQPLAFIGKLSIDGVLYGRLTFLASIQSLDVHGEYQSFGPLSHDTRITALNQNYRLTYELVPTEPLTLALSVHYFDAGPTSRSRLDIGRTDYLLLPSVAARGAGFSAEARWKMHRMLMLTVGADFVGERHLLETFDQLLLQPIYAPDGGTVLRAAGTIIPGQQHGATATFRNVGAFLQGIVTPRPEWTLVGGLRIDDHNIYGANLSARGGVAYTRHDLSVKLLYGSSFKAPSAEQLYAQPIALGASLGNPRLQAQRAYTIELASTYAFRRDRGSIAANLFATDIIGRVEFLPYGNYVRASNIQDEWVVGGELDSRFCVWRSLHLRFSAGVARTISRTPGPSLIFSTPEVLNPQFPTYQAHLIGDYLLFDGRLRLSAEVSYIGPRPASFSNSVILGTVYELDAYVYTALSLSSPSLHLIPKRDTHVALRISNVLNNHYVEPGFGGVDVPAQGIVAFLTIVQAL